MTGRTEKCLLKILEYSYKILTYTADYSFNEFTNDTRTLEAVVFNLSQIGELANLVDDQTKRTNPNIDWNSLRGLRNRIIHNYEGIKPVIIWSIITNDIENLIENIKIILHGN